jgi:hypothetical protein
MNLADDFSPLVVPFLILVFLFGGLALVRCSVDPHAQRVKGCLHAETVLSNDTDEQTRRKQCEADVTAQERLNQEH